MKTKYHLPAFPFSFISRVICRTAWAGVPGRNGQALNRTTAVRRHHDRQCCTAPHIMSTITGCGSAKVPRSSLPKASSSTTVQQKETAKRARRADGWPGGSTGACKRMALCGGCRAYLCGERGQMGESRCGYLILQPAFTFWCRLECAERGLTLPRIRPAPPRRRLRPRRRRWEQLDQDRQMRDAVISGGSWTRNQTSS